MARAKPFIVGRQTEVNFFADLLAGRVDYHVLNIYGPGGIGKTVVGQKLNDHARAQQIPLAMVDGIRPDLTSDRILYALMEGLVQAAANEAMTTAFQPFDQQFKEYVVINQVLQQGGGIQSLFDVVGNVKDPAGLAAILGGLGEVAGETVQRTVNNRFALERYLRGAERTLTATFMTGLQTALAGLQSPVALLFDTYEEMEGLNDWVCRTLIPDLPTAARVVILGRNDLHRVNFDWNDHEENVHRIPLPELAEGDAKSYLRHYGLTDPVALDKVYRFTGGYPLLLVLVRHLAREAGGWQNIGALESSADRDRVATQLLERILRQESVAEVQSFLERGVVARWFDPETIRVILEVNLDDARMIYDKLSRHSFVERHPYGLKFHDKIRELLLERLKFTSEQEFNRLTKRLMDYYAEKAGIVQDAQAESSAQEQTTGDIYHIHIEHGEGIVIGDSARVTQQFGGKQTPHERAASALVGREQRCADLVASIGQTLALIKEYEDQRRLADDPKVKHRAEREIADLRTQLAQYEQAHRELDCEEEEA